MKNEHLVKTALEKQQNILELESRLEAAKDDYSDAVREMHIHGMSFREIAVKLKVSHQRIHQIVEEGRKKKRSWLRLVDYNLKCSFCGLSKQDVAQLVAGPKIFICDVCAHNCSQVVEKSAPIKTDRADFELLQETARLSCSFCDKLSKNRTPVVGTKHHQICGSCLESVLNLVRIDSPGSEAPLVVS